MNQGGRKGSFLAMQIGHRDMPVKRASQKAESGRVFGQRRKQPKMFRVGLYARVSTQDQQTLPLQMRAMREYAAQRGWTITMQIREVGSGAAQRELRARLLDAARRREIDVVLVWRLDRWGARWPIWGSLSRNSRNRAWVSCRSPQLST
jgi:predicted site-specific integrase-resolvase